MSKELFLCNMIIYGISYQFHDLGEFTLTFNTNLGYESYECIFKKECGYKCHNIGSNVLSIYCNISKTFDQQERLHT
jgi:hypothetical protein